jgi:hypothetical protein
MSDVAFEDRLRLDRFASLAHRRECIARNSHERHRSVRRVPHSDSFWQRIEKGSAAAALPANIRTMNASQTFMSES